MFSARAVCLLLIVYFLQTSKADDACDEGAWSNRDPYCYQFEFMPKMWTSARDNCHQSMMMGFMADVNSSDVQSFLDFQTGPVDYWIGLNSLKTQGQWEWDVPDGAAYSHLDGYTNWAPGEPANDPNLRCVQVRHSGSNMGLWYATDCEQTLPYFCQELKSVYATTSTPPSTSRTPTTLTPPTNPATPTGCPDGWHSSQVVSNKCYYVAAQKNIWFDAEAFCTKAGPNAHLTSITSAYENANVDAVVTSTPSISECDQFWIGGNDFDQDGQFVWEDGSPWGYTKWAQGQPDTTQQCVSSTARANGQWKTENCGIKNCFICEMTMSG
uniref:C-type lectin domain-containing protein n=1 Tax=Plectus sambesii TaxID=2011161 RepID=A0A914WNW2_9BILA